jgi:hypothetical protein
MKTLIEHITSNCCAIDTESAYDDMINECYSLEKVGGPFAHMWASRVLKEVDPIAYRCGFSDFADSQREFWAEVDGDYYERREAEKAKEEFVAELQTEADKLQEEVDALRLEDNSSEEIAESLVEDTQAELDAKLAEVKEAEGFDL